MEHRGSEKAKLPAVLDAIVVLGCRILPGGRPSAPGLRRAREAAHVYRAGGARWVVVSGGRRWHGISEAEALASELERLGVPRERMLLELRSLSTCENARNVSELLAEHGLERIGVVTCDWHARRALQSFRAAGVVPEAVPAPSPPEPAHQRLARALRERVSFPLDRWATWGWHAR